MTTGPPVTYIVAMFSGDIWKRIYPRAVRAEKDFSMLEPGDRILAAMSGGADSLGLLALMSYQYNKIGKKNALRVLPGHISGRIGGRPVADTDRLESACRALGLGLVVSEQSLPERAFSDCFLCSQVRRRMLFDLAEKHGCNKIAMGHNADDLVETFLLNAFYSGRLAALSPRQEVLRGRLSVIRPLAYVWKDDIYRFVRVAFGRVPRTSCPGARDNKRLEIRRLLARLSGGNAHLKSNLLKAMANPRLEYLPLPKNKR